VPGESAGVSSGPSVFRVHGEVYRFMGPMRQAGGQQPQTFFVDAAVQTDVDSNLRDGEGEGPAAMLEMNNYVRSFDSIDEQLQSGLLPQSVMQTGTARRPSAEQ